MKLCTLARARALPQFRRVCPQNGVRTSPRTPAVSSMSIVPTDAVTFSPLRRGVQPYPVFAARRTFVSVKQPPLLKYLQKLRLGAPHCPFLPSSLDALGLKYMEDNELRKHFDAFDRNNDGVIDIHEARAILLEAGHMDDDKHALELIAQMNRVAGADARMIDDPISSTITWESFSAVIRKAQQPVDRRAYLIGGSLGLNFTCQGMMIPILPLIGRSVGLSIEHVGFISMANAIARISSMIPLALLVERIGRRPLLVCGPLVSSVAFGVISVSTSWEFLTLGCGLAGVGSAMTMSAAALYLIDLSTPANLSRTMTPLMMSGYFGFSIGPAIGGLLASVTTLQTPAIFCSVGMLTTSAFAYLCLPETAHTNIEHQKAGAGAIVLNQWLRFLRVPELQGINVLNLFSGWAQGAAPVTGILLASETLNMSPAAIGLYFTSCVTAMAVCTPFVTRVSEKLNNRLQLIVPGLMVHSAALALQSAAVTPEWFYALGIIGSIGNSLVVPNLSVYVIEHSKPYERAQALAKLRMSGDVGALMGVGAMAFVASQLGIPVAMQISAALQCCATLFCASRGKLMQSFRTRGKKE